MSIGTRKVTFHLETSFVHALGVAPTRSRSLYEDLAPPDDRTNAATTPRPIAAERPTKTDRRALDRLRGMLFGVEY